MDSPDGTQGVGERLSLGAGEEWHIETNKILRPQSNDRLIHLILPTIVVTH